MPDGTVDTETIELLRRVSTNTVAGLLIKLGGMRTRTVRNARPLNSARARFVGPAFTVRNVPVREDLTDRASMVGPNSPLYGTVDSVPAGSVIVWDMMGDTSCGAVGDIIMAAFAARGVAGFVTDGAMRDGEAVAGGDLPVFCNGVAPAPSNRSLLAAGVQETIGCGGVMVEPGDIVVADPDGVVVIPRQMAAAVAREGAEQEDIEAWIKARIEAGEPTRGLYPPDDRVRADYRAHVAAVVGAATKV